jgi:hypothetical protein
MTQWFDLKISLTSGEILHTYTTMTVRISEVESRGQREEGETCFFGALRSNSLREVRSWAVFGNCFNAGHFRHESSCNCLRCPALPGITENFALLLIYNSLKEEHAPISSGRALRLLLERESLRRAVGKGCEVDSGRERGDTFEVANLRRKGREFVFIQLQLS